MQNKPLACLRFRFNPQDEITEVEVNAYYLEVLARRRGGVFEVLYRFVQAKRDEKATYDPNEPVHLMKELGEYHDSRATLSDEDAQVQLDEFSTYVEETVEKLQVIQDLDYIHALTHEAELRAAANAAERASSGQPQSAVFS